MHRVYNFSAGPAMLPDVVMQQAQQSLLDFQQTGMSVMEISHRSEPFMAVAERAQTTLRALLAIPDNYHVLFLPGGATSQFAMAPMNILGNNATADYFDTGLWSTKAIAEASRYAKINIVASSKQTGYTTIPDRNTWTLQPDAAYLHYTPNETIHGVEFLEMPDFGDVPVVADMSSTILSRPIDVSRFALIYAGAQKNLGPSGITLVIVRDDIIKTPLAGTPGMFQYQNHIKQQSMYNTPATFPWYMVSLVLDWVLAQGGVTVMAQRNQAKSAKLYHAIDNSRLYQNNVAVNCRSWMNVRFTLTDSTLEAAFLQEASAAGLTNLRGHRAVGGMRASLYNAMPEKGVDALIDFMQAFEQTHL